MINQNALNVTKRLVSMGISAITNPHNLEGKYNNFSIVEIKKEPRDNNGQLPSAAQYELSTRGCRLSYIEFHRYFYSMTDEEIQSLKNAFKKYWVDSGIAEGEYRYCDVEMINDAIDYHLCIRSADGFDIQHTSEDVIESWQYNLSLAKDYSEITSEHLIKLTKEIFTHK